LHIIRLYASGLIRAKCTNKTSVLAVLNPF